MAILTNLYGFIDTFGASLGIFTNLILIIAIFKTSGRSKIQSFSYMVLVSAIFDTFFCVIEVLTQHQTLVRKGVLFLMPHGIETVLGEWSYYAFMIPHVFDFTTLHPATLFPRRYTRGLILIDKDHVFSCTMAVVIRGPQYKFRYDLIAGKVDCPVKHLLKLVSIAMCPALFCGVSAAIGVYQAKLRGDKFYLDQFDGPMFNDNVKRDIGTFCFYGGGLVFTTICFWLCVYYVYKSQKAVGGRSEERSERTKALQRQFTLSLIAQSLNACLFAIVPVSVVCFAMLLRLDAEFVGMGTMVPLSYLSSANAVLTLLIVKAYREFLKSLLCGRSSTKVEQSGENNSIVKKQITKTVSGGGTTATPPK